MAAAAVFAPVARAQTATGTVLHAFGAFTGDGASPNAGVIQANDGNFYGTTTAGGANGDGTVYQLTPAGVLTILHSFTGTDGADPQNIVIQGSDGNFYGTTNGGGANGAGTVFQIVGATGVFTSLYSFTAVPSGQTANTDGSSPIAGLVQGRDGNFYGTTTLGGANGHGTFFRITPAGVLTPLYSFTDPENSFYPEGTYAYPTLLLGSDGNFYGATFSGGANSDGTLFQLTPQGALTTLHTFNGSDGQEINARLIEDAAGNFYGTAAGGGADGAGDVFQLTPAGVLNILYSFTGGGDGTYPQADLVPGTDGSFYSVTYYGGASGDGNLYQLTPAGVVTNLYSFSGSSDGAGPAGTGFIQGRDGAFYETTNHGGANGVGTVVRLDAGLAVANLQFSAATATVDENSGNATLSVTRTGSGTGAVSVTYATADGTAVAGTDYTATSGTLSWADGDTAVKTISVPIIARGLNDNSTRTFSVNLIAPVGGAVVGIPATATLTIQEVATMPGTGVQPTIAITSPPDGITVTVGETLPLSASVTDPDGLTSQVSFTVGSALVDTLTSAPYVFDTVAPATPGQYTVQATVLDTLGRVSTASISVNVIAATDTSLPTTGLLTPIDGRDLAAGATVTISFSAASASTTTLDHASLYADGVLVATFDASGNIVSAAPAPGQPTRKDASPLPNLFQTSYTLPTTDKLVNLVAVAFDKLGQSTVSQVATVHALVTTDQAPLVAFANFTTGTILRVGTTNTFTVTASDPDAASTVATAAPGLHRADATGNGTLALLEYYLNGTKIGEAVQPPFTFTFTPPAAGKYVLHAVATDGSGLATISEPAVVVADPAPTVNLALGGTGVAVEGGANGVIVVTRTGDTTSPLVVSYKAKGSAKEGVDYKKLSGTLTIPAGAVKAKIKIKPVGGSPDTGTLKVKLVLLPPADGSYVVGASPAKIKLIEQ